MARLIITIDIISYKETREQAYCEIIKKKSSVNIFPVRFNYQGLPQSGKTAFRQAMMREVLSILIAKIKESSATAECRESVTGSLFNQFTSENPQTLRSQGPPPIFDVHTIFPKSEDVDEAFHCVMTALDAHDWDKVESLLESTVLLINTDVHGQSQFLTLPAAFSMGPSITLLFRRLIDSLDSHLDIPSGKCSEEHSTLTVEEILFQTLSSISYYSHAFSNLDKMNSKERVSVNNVCDKVLFVGTYRDQVSIEEFHKEDLLLQKKITSTEFYTQNLIEFASERQLMFDVNCTNCCGSEKQRLRKVLERIIELVKVRIPTTWWILCLHMYANKLRLMPLADCEELAKKLDIGPKELQDALWFLHHRVGVLLYFPELEVLRDTIICDIQVVFESVNYLHNDAFTFEKVGMRASEVFREKGEFTVEDLQKGISGKFLIPPQKLVKLLELLHMLSPVTASYTQKVVYFMPCALRTATSDELNTTNHTMSSLMLRFKCGYVPIGVFTSIITSIVSQQLDGWAMIEAGLRKNKVQFFVGKDLDEVTLISRPQYLEILISTRSKSFHTPTETLCACIRTTIQRVLRNIDLCSSNPNFVIDFNFAFECPVHSGRDHLCVLETETATHMKCLQNPKSPKAFPLQPQHKVWLKKV